MAHAWSEPEKGAELFPKPERIRYDDHCFILDNKDAFIYSGSFHYFRCPRELWRDRFQKIKEAGFNAVDTYVPWNWHEKQMPASPDDYSKLDLSDLVDWMKMAHEEFGLNTIIRGSPFICAEWDGGGFPHWLLTLKPEHSKSGNWLRSNDPVYLTWSSHWMNALCKVVAPEQITRKPKGAAGVILFQLENEFDFCSFSKADKTEHLRTLYRDSIRGGIEVPMFGNLTHETRSSSDPDLKNTFEGLDFYPGCNVNSMIGKLQKLRQDQPHAPVSVPELQGGWFSQVGGSLSEDTVGLNAAQINYITLTAIEYDVTFLNFYMLFGGTNFENWFGRMGRTAATSYDYNAPIREWGGIGERYTAVKAIGLMLKEHGTALARSTRADCQLQSALPDVRIAVRLGADGQRFIFCRNENLNEARAGRAVVTLGTGQIAFDYNLGPFGAKILRLPAGATDGSKGEWLPKPVAAPERPAVTATAVRIGKAQRRVDATPTSWRPVKPGKLLPALGVYDSRVVLYRARPELTANDITQKPLLTIQLPPWDSVVAEVNGRLFTDGQRLGDMLRFKVGSALKPGANEIVLLYENTGQQNFGREINSVPGIAATALAASDADSGVALDRWSVRVLKNGESPASFVAAAAADDPSWQSFVLNEQTALNLQAAALPGAAAPADKAAGILFWRKATAVFQCSFELNETLAKSPKLFLSIPTIDDSGEVFLNGKSLGKSTDSNKPFNANMLGKVHPGRNVLSILISNKEGAGGLLKTPNLTLVQEGGAKALDLEISDRLDGEARLGWPTTTPTGDWKPVDLDTSKPLPRKGNAAPQGKAENLQVWYRMEFELPEPQVGVWVPWQAVIEASGNGTVFLNGHHLGRYWQAGPQRSFFLPECWLKFGNGSRNILTVGLRSSAEGAVLRAAEIAPYSQYAEKR